MKRAIELQKWSRENWNKVPAVKRQECIDHIRSKIRQSEMNVFINQHQAGIALGEGVEMFHFSYGMQMRNALRDVLLDGELPLVKYEHGQARNWDDYYIGCLEELVEQEISNASHSTLR